MRTKRDVNRGCTSESFSHRLVAQSTRTVGEADVVNQLVFAAASLPFEVNNDGSWAINSFSVADIRDERRTEIKDRATVNVDDDVARFSTAIDILSASTVVDVYTDELNSDSVTLQRNG